LSLKLQPRERAERIDDRARRQMIGLADVDEEQIAKLVEQQRLKDDLNKEASLNLSATGSGF
jgi:hypothetical protein